MREAARIANIANFNNVNVLGMFSKTVLHRLLENAQPATALSVLAEAPADTNHHPYHRHATCAEASQAPCRALFPDCHRRTLTNRRRQHIIESSPSHFLDNQASTCLFVRAFRSRAHTRAAKLKKKIVTRQKRFKKIPVESSVSRNLAARIESSPAESPWKSSTLYLCMLHNQ